MNWNNIKKRMRSKVLWVSIFSLLSMIAGNMGLYEQFGITEESAKSMIDMLFSIMIGFGVFNNPDDLQKF
jgi:uncharacterized membrane protein